MNEREKIIRLWFDMWLQKKDLGIPEMFSDNAFILKAGDRSIMGLQKSNYV